MGWLPPTALTSRVANPCTRAENVCKLPVGTLSDGTDCDSSEAGCTATVLGAAAELTCASGHGGTPAKASAACTTTGGTFTGATFCTGTPPRH